MSFAKPYSIYLFIYLLFEKYCMLDITHSCRERKLLAEEVKPMLHPHAVLPLVGFRYEESPKGKALRLSLKRHSTSRGCLVHY